MTQFSSLSLAAPFLRALHEEGYHTPTPIQAQAIPPAVEGRDLLGCAQTGTGKTAAFALPILHRLHAQPVDKTRRGPVLPRALILSPTRELATQIADSFETYGRHVSLSTAVVFGGVSQRNQVRALQRGVDILVATPGRLMDLMEQRLVHLTDVQTLVLDEADRMLDMGFIQPIRMIAAALPSSRQTMLFSATMPKEIVRLAESLLRDPVRLSVTPVASAAPLISQSVYMVSRAAKQALLEHTIGAGRIVRALVFTRTKHGADRVTHRLNQAGITACAIHGNKAQNQRQRALDAFRSGHSRILVATDVAARGIDVDGITHVFNFDIPNEPEAYVHRIGRTGRAGATGMAISFCDGEERGFLRNIERLTGKAIAPASMPSLPREGARPAAPVAPVAPAPTGAPRAEHAPTHRAPHHAPARPDNRPAGRHDHASPRHAHAIAARPAKGQRSGERHEASYARPGAKPGGGSGYAGGGRPGGARGSQGPSRGGQGKRGGGPGYSGQSGSRSMKPGAGAGPRRPAAQ